MGKKEFLMDLEKRIDRLSEDDKTMELNFYNQQIDQKTNEGKSEDDAIDELGNMDQIVDNIYAKHDIKKINKTKKAFSNIKNIFKTKNKDEILGFFKHILFTLIVIIIIRIPIVFVRDIIIDFLNNKGISYTIQIWIDNGIDIIYYILAIIILYRKTVKKYN